MPAPGRLALSEDDRRILAPWAAACAERVLPRFVAAAPEDPRPREAIEAARSFARGELAIGPARARAESAHAAARAVTDSAAVAAARAAGHAVATAHMAAHARGASGYAALAASLAAPDDPAVPEAEVDCHLATASPEVIDVLRRLPPPPRARSVLARSIARLHEGALVERGSPR